MANTTTEDTIRQRYEVAGRAVHGWLVAVVQGMPEELRARAPGPTVQQLGQRTNTEYLAARALWARGEHAAAANKMQELLRVLRTASTNAVSMARRSGLTAWVRFFASSPVEQALRALDAAWSTVQRLSGLASGVAWNIGKVVGWGLAGLLAFMLLSRGGKK